MDHKAKIVGRKPRDIDNGHGLRRQQPKSQDPGNSDQDQFSGDDGEGESDVEELYHEAKTDSNTKPDTSNSEDGNDDADPMEGVSIKDRPPYSGFMDKLDELEVNIGNLRNDNTTLKSDLEALQRKCADYETKIQAQGAVHEHESRKFEKNMLRLRNDREDYMSRLEIVQKKLLWDYYALKYPSEGIHFKDCHRKGEWLPNDRIVDELLTDYETLGTRNEELLAENQKLHGNLDTLQKSMLANVERFQPTQDDELTEHFDGLASAIKVLTREIPTSIDPGTLADMFSQWTLLRGVSNLFWKTKMHMRCLLEAAIWSLLMDTVFSTPFYIFGGTHAVGMQQWMELFASGETLEASSESGTFHWPAPSPLCEKWRYVTIEQLRNKAIGTPDDLSTSTSTSPTPIDKSIEASYLDARAGIEKLLTDHLTPIAPALKAVKIQKIIKKAWDLAVEMGKQRCRLQLVSPNLGEEYVAGESTSLVGVSGCEGVEEGRVAFIEIRGFGNGETGMGRI